MYCPISMLESTQKEETLFNQVNQPCNVDNRLKKVKHMTCQGGHHQILENENVNVTHSD